MVAQPMPLGELEAKLVADVLAWLCGERVITALAMRNALLAVVRYPGGGEAAKASVRPSLRDGGAS